MVAPGDVLAGRYRIESPLGKGGMATVYRAVDVRLGRDVAIKLLTRERASTATVPERFVREARAMAAIDHPSIVAIYDVVWSAPGGGSDPFLVMEFVAGTTLAERIEADGPLPPEQVVDIVDRMASALAAMHAVGIVHRDVKPQNILLGAAGPKLADLGLVRLTDRSDGIATDLTATNVTIGTLRYLAPEVLDGETAGPPADAFALAMVAFQALTGESPRPAVTLGDLIDAAGRPARLVSDVAPGLDRTYDDAFAGGLELDPVRRLDVVAFATALRRAHVRVARPITVMPAPRFDGLSDAPTTKTAVQALADARLGPNAAQTRAGPSGRTAAFAVPLLGVLAVLAVLALGAIGPVLLAANDQRSPDAAILSSSGPTAVPTVRPTSSASAPASVPATLSAQPTRSAQPTPDQVAAAIATLGTAIEAARGGGGLTGKQANDLRKDLDEIEQVVSKGQLEKAASLARELAGRIAGAVDKEGVDAEDASRLISAADTLTGLLFAASGGG